MSKLFIRSQNKDRVMEVKDLYLEEEYKYNPNNNNGYEEPKVLCCNIYNGIVCVGKYKTTERAMQVLDEICVALSGKVIAQPKSGSKAKEKVGTVGENDSVELKTLNYDAVYQMPQE